MTAAIALEDLYLVPDTDEELAMREQWAREEEEWEAMYLRDLEEDARVGEQSLRENGLL